MKRPPSWQDNPLLSILQCVECGSSPLIAQAGYGGIQLPGVELLDGHLSCAQCETCYPITHDEIPIMWTASLRQYLEGESPDDSALHANIAVYDEISEHYDCFARTEPHIRERVCAAASKLLNRPAHQSRDEDGCRDCKGDSSWHLDFGCGPGQVLSWLKPLAMSQVGLDVSLSNLRIARRKTRAQVVCGDASAMPFRDSCFDLVTESSVLHHIQDWRGAIDEACRICSCKGGVLLDSEPSREQLAFSPLLRVLWTARHPVYRAFSRVMPGKFYHQDDSTTKLSTRAEVHHQPGGGFSTTEIQQLFARNDMEADIVFSPTTELSSKAKVTMKSGLLRLLSLQNPWNPKNGPFVAMARKAA